MSARTPEPTLPSPMLFTSTSPAATNKPSRGSHAPHRPYTTGPTCDVQNAQREAAIGMSLTHSGHGRVLTSTAGAG